MQPHVVRLRDDQQILDRVVEFVAIPVVYSFVTIQWPSERLFRYQAVLKDVVTVDAQLSITELANPTSALPVSSTLSTTRVGTGTRTEAASQTSAKLPLLEAKLASAGFAGQDTIGTADALHGDKVYHFDEEVRS